MENSVKLILEQYDRAKVLEFYFARLDGRTSSAVLLELSDLNSIELADLKAYLLVQSNQDQNIFQLMN